MAMDPTNYAAESRARIEKLERELTAERQALRAYESNHKHDWNPVREVFENYTEFVPDYNNKIIHGVHLDYDMKSVLKSRTAWERSCKICGKLEKTTQTAEVVTKVPKF